MGAVTYPDSRVARTIQENFIPVQINITEETPEVQEAIQRYRQMWTPTIVVLDPEGKEVRRSQGYFPPEEFIPELLMGLGQTRMLDKDYAGAYRQFEKVRNECPGTRGCEESTYWLGVSGYKRDDNADVLMKHWNELKEKYPNSPWWQKASFIADN